MKKVPVRRGFSRRVGPTETRFRLTLQYDGSAFHGWQIQPRTRTVQGELERVVKRLTGSRRPVEASGRTDAGVHAIGQVAAVTMPASWTNDQLQRSLNALLPTEIWVETAQRVPLGFNPRFDAVARTYRYYVGTTGAASSPFHRRWCWPVEDELDRAGLDDCSALLGGTGDFSRFRKVGQPQRGNLCVVNAAGWFDWEQGIYFEITANRYLHHMVRYLVGTMVDVARRRRSLDDWSALVDGDDRRVTSPPAPSKGLFLWTVHYPDFAAGPSPAPSRWASTPKPERTGELR